MWPAATARASVMGTPALPGSDPSRDRTERERGKGRGDDAGQRNHAARPVFVLSVREPRSRSVIEVCSLGAEQGKSCAVRPCSVARRQVARQRQATRARAALAAVTAGARPAKRGSWGPCAVPRPPNGCTATRSRTHGTHKNGEDACLAASSVSS